MPGGERYNQVRSRARGLRLHTVCEEAHCPNVGECWQAGTATFMVLGDTCTRGCRFCAVSTARNPPAPDPAEPEHLARAIAEMDLDYVVVTSVNRDDLPDEGAGHFAACVRAIRHAAPGTRVETLVPDFVDHLDALLEARPDVLAHNVETVPRLQQPVRDARAGWARSLATLAAAKRRGFLTKTSIQLGHGETLDEVREAMRALRAIDVDFLTLGQYLRPSPRHLPVQAFVPPESFAALEAEGRAMGFGFVASGPLVRSSYRAAEYFIHQHLHRRDEARA
jgi:lipoic acid synthetase